MKHSYNDNQNLYAYNTPSSVVFILLVTLSLAEIVNGIYGIACIKIHCADTPVSTSLPTLSSAGSIIAIGIKLHVSTLYCNILVSIKLVTSSSAKKTSAICINFSVQATNYAIISRHYCLHLAQLEIPMHYLSNYIY